MNDLCYRGVIFSDSVVLRVVCLRVHVGTRIGTTPHIIAIVEHIACLYFQRNSHYIKLAHGRGKGNIRTKI